MQRKLSGLAAARAWQAIGVAGFALFVLHVCLDVGGTASGSFYDWLYDSLLVWATVALCARAALVREERLPWTLLAVSLALWTAGDVYYNANADTIGFPSVADGLYLVFYPLAYAAVLLL